MFDWTADITGTGDRSEYIVESDQKVWKKLLIKIRIKRHKCLHPFSSLLIADYSAPQTP